MTAAWVKWRISTAVEKGKPLSSRLARKVRSDRECRRFYEASLAMATRLREEAADLVKIEQGRMANTGPVEFPERPQPASHVRALHWRGAFALATAVSVTGLVLGAGVWWFASLRPAPEPERRIVSQQANVAHLAAIIRQIKDDVDKVAARKGPEWKERMARSREALRAPIAREATNIAKDTREIFQIFSSIIPSGDDSQESDSEDDPRWPT